MKDLLNKHVSLFIRNLEAIDYLENFLVSAVAAILAIRVFLTLTGFPQIAGAGLHIAHVLWGGVFMAIALFFSLFFLNKEARHISAVLGGAGFGTFIDELGKFITADNNYFFQPTIALIYLIFVILFLLIRTLEKNIQPTQKEYALNALEHVKEAVFNDLDKIEKEKVELYLKKMDPKDSITKAIIQILESEKLKNSEDVYILSRLKNYLRTKYTQTVRRKRFANYIMWFFVIIAFANLVNAFLDTTQVLNFWDVGLVLSSLLSVVYILCGVYFYYKSHHLKSYQSYKMSVIVSILLVQFFKFYHNQLSALIGLLVYTTVLAALDFLISELEPAK